MKGRGLLWLIVVISLGMVAGFSVGCLYGSGDTATGDDDTVPNDDVADDDTEGGPNAPSNLTAAYTEFGVELNWNDNATDESGFYIYRQLEGEGNFTKVGEVGADITTFVDDTFACDNSATYYVTAYNASGESDPSNEADTGLIICAPTNFAVDAYYGDTTDDIDIELYWDDNSNIEDGYRVEKLAADKQEWETLATLDADSTSYSYTIDCSEYEKDAQYRVVAYKDTTDSLPAEDVLARGMGCFTDYTIAESVFGVLIAGGLDSSSNVHALFGWWPPMYFSGFGDNWDNLLSFYGVGGYFITPSATVDSQDVFHGVLSGYSYFGITPGKLRYFRTALPAAAAASAAGAGDDKACWDAEISCGETDEDVELGNSNSISSYSCTHGWDDFYGPDYTYKITVPESGILSVNVEGNEACYDLFVFLLSNCYDGDSCLAWGYNGLTAAVSPGTYYIVVDTVAYYKETCYFDITVDCKSGWEIVDFDSIGGYSFFHDIDTTADNKPVIGMINAGYYGYGKEEPGATVGSLYKTASGTWIYEKVDSTGYTGGYAAPSVSVKVDSEGDVHMVYQKDATRNDDMGGFYAYVVHAQKTGGSWVTENIETVTLGYAGYYGYYHILLPQFSSMDVDRDNMPHVSFFNMTYGYYGYGYYDLKHAYKESKGWQSEVVDSIYGYGYYDVSSSLEAFEWQDTEVHIAYSSFYEGLKYATNASGEWRTYYLVYPPEWGKENGYSWPLFPRIFVDSDGYIYILYMSGRIFGSDNEFKLLTNRPLPE